MIIEFEKIFNARDLGGIPTTDGHRVKTGLLLRTAKLNSLTDADAARLEREFHLRHIVDFRDDSEAAAKPDRPIPGAVFHVLPVLPELPGNNNADYLRLSPERVGELMRGIYRTMAQHEKSAAAYRAFFDTLLTHPGESVLWHCTQGKDRTGIAAMVILYLLGADDDVIMEDYLLTNTYRKKAIDHFMSSQNLLYPEDPGYCRLAFMRGGVDEGMGPAALQELHLRYVSPLEYAKDQYGWSKENFDSFRNDFLTE